MPINIPLFLSRLMSSQYKRIKNKVEQLNVLQKLPFAVWNETHLEAFPTQRVFFLVPFRSLDSTLNEYKLQLVHAQKRKARAIN